MEKYLNIGSSLSDRTQIGKMKDIYPLKLFQLVNAIKLKNEGEIPSAAYLLIYALWNEVMNSQVISRKTRIGFLEIIFETLLILYKSIQGKSNLITLKQTNGTKA